MIYMDSSEDRMGTRLSEYIREYAQPVAGLEAQTGADLLISPLEEPLPSNVNRPPGSLLLRKHVEAGMLVQRKSGGDMLNSIPKLGSILQRMQQWDTVCWLLVCGDYKPNHEELAIADGRTSGWSWASLQGALDSWVLRGGLIHQEPDDEHGGHWLHRWDMNIHKLRKDAIVKPPVQKTVGGMFDPHPWRITLMSMPDCGEQLSREIAGYCNTLAHSLWWMTDSEIYGNIKGVGDKRRAQWRKWLGLAEDEVLLPIKVADKAYAEIVPMLEKKSVNVETDLDALRFKLDEIMPALGD